MRLPNSRRGKTPVDVTITRQKGLQRVRLSMGNDPSSTSTKNTDLTPSEARDLATILNYYAAVVEDGLPDPDEGV